MLSFVLQMMMEDIQKPYEKLSKVLAEEDPLIFTYFPLVDYTTLTLKETGRLQKEEYIPELFKKLVVDYLPFGDETLCIFQLFLTGFINKKIKESMEKGEDLPPLLKLGVAIMRGDGTTFHQLYHRYNYGKALKEELMPIAWHPNQYWDWCMSDDEKQEISRLWS